jgi:hypothetical protein
MTYGFDALNLMVWIDTYDRAIAGRAGVLCRRHADAMVVPLGWMLDDRREPIPRLFKAPAPTVTTATRQRRSPNHQHIDAEQLELGAEVVVVLDMVDVDDEAIEPEVLPWKPTFDQTDNLNGLLEARGPLLARAFGGQDRRRPGR